MKKAIAVLMFALAAVAAFVAGCGSKYNATLISNADDIINPNFLNRTGYREHFTLIPTMKKALIPPTNAIFLTKVRPKAELL